MPQDLEQRLSDLEDKYIDLYFLFLATFKDYCQLRAKVNYDPSEYDVEDYLHKRQETLKKEWLSQK